MSIGIVQTLETPAHAGPTQPPRPSHPSPEVTDPGRRFALSEASMGLEVGLWGVGGIRGVDVRSIYE